MNANPNLHDLALRGDTEKIKDALSSAEAIGQLLAMDIEGRIPLHLAARHVDPSAAKELLTSSDVATALAQLHQKSTGTPCHAP